MKQENLVAQQGDMLIYKIDVLPKDLKIRKDNVALDGLKRHVAKGDGTVVFDGYISTSETCIIEHPEHKNIALTPGNYEIKRVVEYDHLLEESRLVVD